MTASTETGVEEFNEIGGNHSNAAVTDPTTNPPEPEQQITPSTTGGIRPHDSGVPQSHILTEDEG